MTPTPRQKQIIDLIQKWRHTQGVSPTLQELADELSVSKVTIFEHVRAMVAAGYLVQDESLLSRNIRLASEPMVDLDLVLETIDKVVGRAHEMYPKITCAIRKLPIFVKKAGDHG